MCIRPCGHNTDHSFCPITFKLNLQFMDDEGRTPIDFGSWDHTSRSILPPPLARGCHALHCLVLCYHLCFKFLNLCASNMILPGIIYFFIALYIYMQEFNYLPSISWILICNRIQYMSSQLLLRLEFPLSILSYNNNAEWPWPWRYYIESSSWHLSQSKLPVKSQSLDTYFWLVVTLNIWP